MDNIAKEKSRLQLITNQWSSRSIPSQVQQACAGGCRWIQLRLKDINTHHWMEILAKVKPICRQYGALLVMNDHVEMALKAGADGVHLGKDDMCPSEARKILGRKSIIGSTAHSLEDIFLLEKKEIDYLGVGPYRYTPTKRKLSSVLGTEGYRQVVETMKNRDIVLPVIAVGGIALDDIPDLMHTGIHGIAVSSNMANHTDPRQWTKNAFIQIQKEVTNDHIRQ